jgi:hypothetical protein
MNDNNQNTNNDQPAANMPVDPIAPDMSTAQPVTPMASEPPVSVAPTTDDTSATVTQPTEETPADTQETVTVDDPTKMGQ